MTVAAILFVALAVGLTWPLARHIGASTPDEFRDARLTTWVLAWDAHVLGGDPTDLFQVPIFHPERDALAYTDHMLGLGVFAAPVTWLTGNAFAGHNVVFILSIAFAALATTLAAFELTGSYPAALVAGAAFAFAPYWANHGMHAQIVASGWIPMALFGLVRWWRTERVSALGVAGGSAVLAALTSWYQAAFVLVAIVVVVAVFVVVNRPARLLRMTAHAAIAAALATAALWPFAAPYRRVEARDPEYTRTLSNVALLSAKPKSYLAAAPSNLMYGDATSRWSSYPRTVELNLFPGALTVLLAGLGIAAAKRNRQERAAVAALVVLVAAGVVLSFGAAPSGSRRFLPWAFLADHVVLFRGLRAAARAHVLVVLGLSMLGAFGARALIARTGRRAAVAAAVIASVVVLEGASVPRELGPAPRAPAVYASLTFRPGAILELPAGRDHDADHMLRGREHWRPLANGIAGYTPSSYRELLLALGRPPARDLITLVRTREIRTVILHLDLLGPSAAELDDFFSSEPGVVALHREDALVIYDVAPG